MGIAVCIPRLEANPKANPDSTSNPNAKYKKCSSREIQVLATTSRSWATAAASCAVLTCCEGPNIRLSSVIKSTILSADILLASFVILEENQDRPELALMKPRLSASLLRLFSGTSSSVLVLPGRVGAIAIRVARQQAVSGNRRVSREDEVWQVRSPHPAIPPLRRKALPGEECGLVGELFSLREPLSGGPS